MRFFIKGQIWMTCFTIGTSNFRLLLHFTENICVKFKELFWLSFYISLRYFADILFQLFSFQLFLFLFAFTSDILFCDKLHINIRKHILLPTWILTNWKLDTESIDPFFIFFINRWGEMPNLFQISVFIGKGNIDVVPKRI